MADRDDEIIMRPKPAAMGNLFGREDTIRAGRCLVCPGVYTREVIAMWPMIAQQEYQTCGLCRNCQAVAFAEDTTRCTCDSPCCEADVGVGVITCGSQHCWIHGGSDG